MFPWVPSWFPSGWSSRSRSRLLLLLGSPASPVSPRDLLVSKRLTTPQPGMSSFLPKAFADENPDYSGDRRVSSIHLGNTHRHFVSSTFSYPYFYFLYKILGYRKLLYGLSLQICLLRPVVSRWLLFGMLLHCITHLL